MENLSIQLFLCKICKIEKLRDDFYFRKTVKTPRVCKLCENIKKKKYKKKLVGDQDPKMNWRKRNYTI